MLYCSLGMACDGCNLYFSFWVIFCPFTTLKAPKNKSLKNEKTLGDIIILHKCTKNHDHMVYCSWNMAHDKCNLYFSFWPIFCPFTHLKFWKKQNFTKMKKNLEISLYTRVPKFMITWCTVSEIWFATDGQMDRHLDGPKTVTYIEVGAPRKN